MAMKNIYIGSRAIGENQPCFFVAEAGVNHGGDLAVAKQLVDVALDAGADAVKFQAFRTEHLIIESVEKAPYQKANSSASESQADMLRALELRTDHYRELKEYCEKRGIVFLITPFDPVSLAELEELGVLAYKVASTDTTNLPFLRMVCATGKPVILSTGMTYMEEIRQVLDEIRPLNSNIILLQCTANYPIKNKEANLRVIDTFREKFGILTGYSDHTVGVGAAPYAVARGAVMVEKHFTLDKTFVGPDHKASLNPTELRSCVAEIRRTETFLGSADKKPTSSEIATRSSLQKCLVAARDLPGGIELSEADFTAKRTGGAGISPLRYRELVGKTLPVDLKANDILPVDLL